ncbi:MAG: DUF3108 domain-containing protein [Acidobacteriota bacterium]
MKIRTQNLFIAFLLIVACAGSAYSQKPATAVLRAFEPTEDLIYDAEFSRALLRKVDIADLRLSASRPSLLHKVLDESAKVPDKLVLTCSVSSKGFFAKLFGLRFRETLESIVDPVSLSVENSKRVDEQGKRLRSSEAIFDTARGKVSWTERDPGDAGRAPRVVNADFSGQVHDILSAIYFLRTQPLTVGKSMELSISDSGQVYQVPIRVLERKRLKTVVGRVDALLLEADLFGIRGMLEGEGKFFIWLTDDVRRIPVAVKIKSEYGTFDIRLKKISATPSDQPYLSKQD